MKFQALGAAVEKLNFIAQLAATGAVQSMDIRPFLDLNAHKYIFGYDDKIYSLARPFLAFEGKYLSEKFGLLAAVS